MEQVTANKMTFDYAVGGDGSPVVLLHGFPESAASWEPVASRLWAGGLRTFAPNQRGYSPGARPPDAAAYALDQVTTDVLALADAWGLEKFHLVGHDWGAAAAWSVAAHHPERVATLTAVSVPHLAAFGWALAHDPDQQQRSTYMRLFRDGDRAERLLLPDNARRLRAIFGDEVDTTLTDRHVALLSEPGALTAALNWYRAMTPQAELPSVRVPTTYVWSTEDMAMGRAGAQRCGDHVDADYRFVVLDGVSHWIPEEAPDALATAILERVGSDSSPR